MHSVAQVPNRLLPTSNGILMTATSRSPSFARSAWNEPVTRQTCWALLAVLSGIWRAGQTKESGLHPLAFSIVRYSTGEEYISGSYDHNCWVFGLGLTIVIGRWENAKSRKGEALHKRDQPKACHRNHAAVNCLYLPSLHDMCCIFLVCENRRNVPILVQLFQDVQSFQPYLFPSLPLTSSHSTGILSPSSSSSSLSVPLCS